MPGLLELVKNALKDIDEREILQDFDDEELQKLADNPNSQEDTRVSLFVLLVGEGLGGARRGEEGRDRAKGMKRI